MGVSVATGSGVREVCNREPGSLPSDLLPPPSCQKAGDICAFRHIHGVRMFVFSASRDTGQLNTDHAVARLVSVKLEGGICAVHTWKAPSS